MFRPIRKKKNEISTDEALALLQDSRRGVLAVNGDDGYPYAIPVNYYFDKENRKIYFHGVFYCGERLRVGSGAGSAQTKGSRGR